MSRDGRQTNKRDRVGWRGYLPATVTPFDREGNLDLQALGGMLEWLHGEGMHGLLIAGTTGEWTSLSAAERAELFAAAGAQMGKRLPLIAGCSAFRPSEVVEFAEHAAASGFEGLLVTIPPYLRPRDEEIVDFYSFVAANVRLPICIYNWPPGTNVELSLPLLSRLADIENVVAIKQSTSQLRNFVDTVFALEERVRVFGYSMDEHGLAMLAARGGDGTMGSGGALGRDHPDFFNHLWNGDLEAARLCGQRDRLALSQWFNGDLTGRLGSAAATMKTALNLQGVPGGHVRAPLRDLDAAGQEVVRGTLTALGKI